MGLIDKPLESITEQDLLDLISNQVREDKRIEFKAISPGNSDKQKKEFLADVSSFANASGGDLIFGIKTLNGVASQLVGLQLASLDAEILRLENILRDGLDPRVPNVRIRGISLTSGVALIIRVTRSWIPPHRVKHGGTKDSIHVIPLGNTNSTFQKCVRCLRCQRQRPSRSATFESSA